MCVNLNDIESAVNLHFNLRKGLLRGPGRRRSLVIPRFIAMTLSREMKWSLSKIGRYYFRDHTTVLNALQRMPVLAAKHPEVKLVLDECRAEVIPITCARESEQRDQVACLEAGEVTRKQATWAA